MRWGALIVVAAALLGCKGRLPGARAERLREVQQTTALAWVNALAARDENGARLRPLTADSLLFRTMSAEKSCEGQVTGDAAFAVWFSCTGAKPDLQDFSGAVKVYRDALRTEPTRYAEFAQYLPGIVAGNDAWSHYRSGEGQRAQQDFNAFQKEAGSDGGWTGIAAAWLYTTALFRVQVVGGAESPRVHAVFVDIGRSPD